LRYFDSLAADFRVLAIDPLGHGDSAKPGEPEHYTEPEVVEDLVAVLDRDESEKAHVWGYSRGAHHAFLLAKAYPDRVLTLTAGGYSPTAAPERRGHLLIVASALHARDWDRVFELLEISDPGTRAVLMDNDPAAMAAALEMTYMEAVHLSQVRVPTLLYAGSEEPLLEQARKDAKRLGGRFEEVAGRDHAGTFQSADLVLPMVVEHLQRVRQ
jgi:pimeloyl-ACP methyl ester carboxylesterase